MLARAVYRASAASARSLHICECPAGAWRQRAPALCKLCALVVPSWLLTRFPLPRAAASLRAAAAAPTGAAPATAKQGYEAMEIAPTTVPGREYKNEYYAKRGYKLADKSWTVRARARDL
jgi:hypothetical protein